MAVSLSVLAVLNGVTQVQGTFLGYGERCGNANLSAIIANLELKRNILCLPEGNIKELTNTARIIAEISNFKLLGTLPFVGETAFAHKAGMHVDGVFKNSKSFEHISPELVGNERKFLISEVAGKATVLAKIQKIYPNISLGTVYRNLNFLVEHGEAQKLSCDDNKEHYDGNTTPHSHFYCRSCRQVSDLNTPTVNLPDLLKDTDFKVNAHHDVMTNGMEVYRVNGVTILPTSRVADGDITAIHKSAVAYGMQLDNMEAMRLESTFADGIRGLQNFGITVVRPEAIEIVKAK